MVLEASMFVVDNSDWMRNEDYTQTRFRVQHEAVEHLCRKKIEANPESEVGLMAMGGKQHKVQTTFTKERGKISSGLHNISIGGMSDFYTGVQIARLALKHRQNKLQRQRIIVFVASPVITDEKILVKLAKKLKKDNVAIDIVNFGEVDANTTKLDAFIKNVSSDDNSKLITITPGPYTLISRLNSLISSGEDSNLNGNDFEDYGEEDDPELALALRISREEEAARLGLSNERAGESTAADADNHDLDEMMDADPELRAALALSMQDQANQDEDVNMQDNEAEEEAMSEVLGSLRKDQDGKK